MVSATAMPIIASPKNPLPSANGFMRNAALDGCADELSAAPKGERNDTLEQEGLPARHNDRARLDLDRAEVIDALFAAAATCGLNADDGEEATRKTLKSGLDNGEKCPHPDLDTNQQETFTEPPTSSSWKYHTGAAPAPLRWLIKGILPETGVALMAGQWGTFKTTVALDAVGMCDGRPAVCRPLSGQATRRRPLYCARRRRHVVAHACQPLLHIAVLAGHCRSPGAATVRHSRTKMPPPSYAPSPTRRQPISSAILVCRWC